MDKTQAAAPAAAGRRRRGFAVLGVLLCAALTGGYFFRGYSLTHLKTDDAFVEGAIHVVAPRVAGTVRKVLVENNQRVSAGDTLLELDDDLLAQRLAEAESGLSVEKARLVELAAVVKAGETKVAAAAAAVERVRATREELLAQAGVREAEVRARAAETAQTDADLKRLEILLSKQVVPRTRYDAQKTLRDTAQAALEAARERKRQADLAVSSHESVILEAVASRQAEEAELSKVRAAVKTQERQVSVREAQAETARLTLSYSRVAAPADGFVTRRAVEVGNQVQAGQPVMSVVSLEDAYVVANYKETRLHAIHPGQKVLLRLDAFPDGKFTGRVDSIMAGTGSAFSLFPPENASGNYVKVVQRVPVRIRFEDQEAVLPYLRVGMSVVPTILTGE